MLDAECLKYKYSELSAAIIWCCYEPESLVQEVTGNIFMQNLLLECFRKQNNKS